MDRWGPQVGVRGGHGKTRAGLLIRNPVKVKIKGGSKVTRNGEVIKIERMDEELLFVSILGIWCFRTVLSPRRGSGREHEGGGGGRQTGSPQLRRLRTLRTLTD